MIAGAHLPGDGCALRGNPVGARYGDYFLLRHRAAARERASAFGGRGGCGAACVGAPCRCARGRRHARTAPTRRAHAP
eukprot:5060763-Prymnesium_polylepis.2